MAEINKMEMFSKLFPTADEIPENFRFPKSVEQKEYFTIN